MAATGQCDISVGKVMEARILRVTPPNMNSRIREWRLTALNGRSTRSSATSVAPAFIATSLWSGVERTNVLSERH